MSESVYGPIITAAATVLFGWLLASGFRTGRMDWPYFAANLSGRRSDQPVRFWVLASLLGGATLLMLIGTLGQVFWPHGL